MIQEFENKKYLLRFSSYIAEIKHYIERIYIRLLNIDKYQNIKYYTYFN